MAFEEQYQRLMITSPGKKSQVGYASRTLI